MSVSAANSKGSILVSALGVFGAAFLWLLSFKIIAYWIGPEGVGLFSQLRQMAQAATIGATFGGTNSVVQGLSERDDELARQRFRATAARLVGAAGVIVVLGTFAAAPQLSRFLLSSDQPALVEAIRCLAIAVMFSIIGTYTLGVLNGYRSYTYLALAQIAGPAALVTVLAVSWWWHLPQGPIQLAILFVICFGATGLVGLLAIHRLPSLAVLKNHGLNNLEARAFLFFALSNLGAAMATTFTLLLVRAWVIKAEGLAFAGLFDAAWTLTFNYTTLFLTACSAIYLPLLTRAVTNKSQKICMLKTAYLVLAGGVVVCYGMVLFKTPIIQLLYSSEFRPSGSALSVLVVAMLLRSTSWVYGAMILATGKSGVLLFSEVMVNLVLLATVQYALNNHASLSALAWAFVLPNFLYLVFVIEYARYRNPLMLRRHIWPLVLAAILPLVVVELLAQRSARDLGAIQWIFMSAGPVVAVVCLRFFKKVTL